MIAWNTKLLCQWIATTVETSNNEDGNDLIKMHLMIIFNSA
jgi:hypothetical protein